VPIVSDELAREDQPLLASSTFTRLATRGRRAVR
jgi:hypothetical protein